MLDFVIIQDNLINNILLILSLHKCKELFIYFSETTNNDRSIIYEK